MKNVGLVCCALITIATAAGAADLALEEIVGRSASTVFAADEYDAAKAQDARRDLYERLVGNRAEHAVIDLGELSAREAVELAGRQAVDLRRMLVGVDRAVDAVVDLAPMSVDSTQRGVREGVGAVHDLANGAVVWSASFRSPGAAALRAHLTDIDLPAGAELYVYGETGDAFGPYMNSNRRRGSEIWTNTVIGEVLTLQLEIAPPVRAEQLHASYFVIGSLGHMGDRFDLARWGTAFPEKSFCGGSTGPVNASCVENASCSQIPAAITPAEKAVAAMLFRSAGGYYICSGGLVADSAGSMTPYFLTANHCISKGGEASSLETYFDFTAPCGTTSCGYAWDGGRATPGASILSTNRISDYTLLQLDAIPSGRAFLGWNSSPVANSNSFSLHRISHPAGAPQAYSTHAVNTSAGTCRTWPRGDWIYSRDTSGATEGGSSGSPVLNGSGEIVGQLSGACGTNLNDNCDSTNNATVDGAFAAYFGSVSQWLDGGGSGCTPSIEVCDGIDNDCDGLIDEDGVCGGGSCDLGQIGDSCSQDADCCSNKCRGRAGAMSCR